MENDRLGRGFARAGSCGPERLGLPKARARDLRLLVAWREAAGEAIARKTEAVRVRGGVLEVELADPSWEPALQPLMPRLAGRVAVLQARFAVRRCRLIVRDGEGLRRGELQDVVADGGRTRRGRSAAERRAADDAVPAGEPGARLERAAERCLGRRGAAQNP